MAGRYSEHEKPCGLFAGRVTDDTDVILEDRVRFELTTPRLRVSRSNQLSYRSVKRTPAARHTTGLRGKTSFIAFSAISFSEPGGHELIQILVKNFRHMASC